MATKKTAVPAAKPEEKKVAPAAEVKAEAPKAEVKAEAAPKAAAKPAEKKAAPAKKETKPAEKKAPKAAAKPAEKKAAAPAKKEAKPAAKKAAPAKKEIKPAEKKAAPRKVKQITAADVAAKVAKMVDKTKAKKIDGKVAVDIKLYGAFEGHMYIEVKDGVATVAPYDYVEKDIEAAVSVENAIAIADGKLAIADAIADGRLYVNGNLTYVMKLASILK